MPSRSKRSKSNERESSHSATIDTTTKESASFATTTAKEERSMSKTFEFELDGQRYRILCQVEEPYEANDATWSSCAVPQVIRDAINERMGKPTDSEGK
jgi:hypothetical protein